MSDYLDLYDFRLRVAALYRERNHALLAGQDAATVIQCFRQAKDEIFAHHPQSALDEEQRRVFQGLHYFPYNPKMCFEVEIDTDVVPTRRTAPMNADESMTMTTVGRVHFTVEGEPVALSIYWLDVYGGGLFLPFLDATCPAESYGGGRYLFDTIKGSDFLPARCGSGSGEILLDFNYASNPSCASSDRWVCPLAPSENRLRVPIRAGEKNFKTDFAR